MDHANLACEENVEEVLPGTAGIDRGEFFDFVFGAFGGAVGGDGD